MNNTKIVVLHQVEYWEKVDMQRAGRSWKLKRSHQIKLNFSTHIAMVGTKD